MFVFCSRNNFATAAIKERKLVMKTMLLRTIFLQEATRVCWREIFISNFRIMEYLLWSDIMAWFYASCQIPLVVIKSITQYLYMYSHLLNTKPWGSHLNNPNTVSKYALTDDLDFSCFLWTSKKPDHCEIKRSIRVHISTVTKCVEFSTFFN